MYYYLRIREQKIVALATIFLWNKTGKTIIMENVKVEKTIEDGCYESSIYTSQLLFGGSR